MIYRPCICDKCIACPSETASVIGLFVAFTKRMRDEIGAKFQLVVFATPSADCEGVISVKNEVEAAEHKKSSLVYWVAGAAAGCAVNKSTTNKEYDGELEVKAGYTQIELKECLKKGEFVLHRVNDTIKVLEDINTLVTVTENKGEIFKANQTVRVCDQIANDIAVIFNTRYLGNVPNDADGRISLWNDICKLLGELEGLRAIKNFDTKTVVVEPGESKKAVCCNISGLNIVNAMAQLYMSVIIE